MCLVLGSTLACEMHIDEKANFGRVCPTRDSVRLHARKMVVIEVLRLLTVQRTHRTLEIGKCAMCSLQQIQYQHNNVVVYVLFASPCLRHRKEPPSSLRARARCVYIMYLIH